MNDIREYWTAQRVPTTTHSDHGHVSAVGLGVGFSPEGRRRLGNPFGVLTGDRM
jgi:hypothetical protein